jgi:hypothetical protein
MNERRIEMYPNVVTANREAGTFVVIKSAERRTTEKERVCAQRVLTTYALRKYEIRYWYVLYWGVTYMTRTLYVLNL